MSTTPVTGPSLPPLLIRPQALPASPVTQPTQTNPIVTEESPQAEAVAQEALNLQTPAQAGSATQALGFVDSTPANPVTPSEKRWVANLVLRMDKGYEPNPDEMALYSEIVRRMADELQPEALDINQTEVSQDELDWALQLEEKVKMGYQPTPTETKAYQDIAQRLSHQPLNLPSEVSKAEVNWALQLENQVLRGYQPSEEEVLKYQDIASRLKKAPPPTPTPEPPAPPSPVTAAELDWAQQLAEKVSQGYQPTPQEVSQYEDIYRRHNTETKVDSTASDTDAVGAAELEWAVQLMERVTQGYVPTPAETKIYQQIYTRYQEQKESDSVLPPGVPAASGSSQPTHHFPVQPTSPPTPQEPTHHFPVRPTSSPTLQEPTHHFPVRPPVQPAQPAEPPVPQEPVLQKQAALNFRVSQWMHQV